MKQKLKTESRRNNKMETNALGEGFFNCNRCSFTTLWNSSSSQLSDKKNNQMS